MIPADKIAHFAVGVLIFASLSWLSVSIAFLAVIIAAVGKEIYDSKHPDKHTSDFWDAIATIFGGCIGIFIKVF